MKIKNNQKGIAQFATLVLIAVIVVICVISWGVRNHNSTTKTTNDSSKSTQSQKVLDNKQRDNINTVTLTLASKSTGSAISGTKVRIYSDNGVRCIQAPCPTNGKSWDGITNKNGEIFVSNDYIQSNTNVTPEGFSGKYIDYKANQTAYSLEL